MLLAFIIGNGDYTTRPGVSTSEYSCDKLWTQLGAASFSGLLFLSLFVCSLLLWRAILNLKLVYYTLKHAQLSIKLAVLTVLNGSDQVLITVLQSFWPDIAVSVKFA